MVTHQEGKALEWGQLQAMGIRIELGKRHPLIASTLLITCLSLAQEIALRATWASASRRTQPVGTRSHQFHCPTTASQVPQDDNHSSSTARTI